jgi:hypothetical protein
VRCARQGNGPYCTELQGGVNRGVRTREPSSRCPKSGGQLTKSAQEPTFRENEIEVVLIVRENGLRLWKNNSITSTPAHIL